MIPTKVHHLYSRPLRDGLRACRRRGLRATRFILLVAVGRQELCVLERVPARCGLSGSPLYAFQRRCVVSTSRFGVGQIAGSNQTPLGLHRIAAKIGGGYPIGSAFRSRRAIGLIWSGQPSEPIVHRILWLEGLEPGRNRGGDVDSYSRYIYIHGTNDEFTLGRPASRGCIHVAAADLLPLFDRLPAGTLVWIY